MAMEKERNSEESKPPNTDLRRVGRAVMRVIELPPEDPDEVRARDHVPRDIVGSGRRMDSSMVRFGYWPMNGRVASKDAPSWPV